MKLHMFGDSIPTGAGAGAAHLGFASKLAVAIGATLVNNAKSGGMAIDNTLALLNTVMSPGDIGGVMSGTNDNAIYDLDVAKRGFYISSLLAHAVILACGYVKVNPSNVTLSGVWGSAGYDNSFATAVPGAKASFLHTGNTVAIGYIRQFNNGAKFKVTIDGVEKGIFDVGGDVRSYLKTPHGCACEVFQDLGTGQHFVEVEAVSANDQNVVYFQWFSAMQPKNKVLFINTPHAVNYTYGGSDANVDVYNADELAMVNRLRNIGLDIRYADVCSELTALDMVDDVHPNASGHQKIFSKCNASINAGDENETTFSEAKLYLGSDGLFYAKVNDKYVQVN